MIETIPLSIKYEGQVYQLENWMLIIALAKNDVEWAKKLIEDPEYNISAKINDFKNRQIRQQCKKRIDYFQKEIEILKKTIQQTFEKEN